MPDTKKKQTIFTPKGTGRIAVRGAREHNLKNIDVDIPKDTLTVITGPSGSGKSSLALDILFTEGKRRYMESLSSYARQFLGIAKKPDVDSIDGLCPSIAIEQKTVSANPRSTVGTITEIYDYLRVLYARIGTVHCPHCSSPIQAESPENIVRMVLANFKGQVITIAAPIANERKGEFLKELLHLFNDGYYRFNIDGKLHRFTTDQEIHQLGLKKTIKHTIDVLIDAVEVDETEQHRLQEGVEKSFELAGGVCKVLIGEREQIYSCERMCVRCARSVPEMEPRLFSFNSPIGACKACSGLGATYEWSFGLNSGETENISSWATCRACEGKRLNAHALAVTIGDKNIYELCSYAVDEMILFLEHLKLDETAHEIGKTLLAEISARLQFLRNVGLTYLTLNRAASTLSGGESQRIRLATQIGSALSGVLYILDEPSIGLHQRDNDRLIATLHALRDQGNTVVVVEHDSDTMLQSDYLIDMGPAAGVLGGNIVATGTPQEIMENSSSLTGAYLSGKRAIALPAQYRQPQGFITLKHARKNNLKDVEVRFPLGVICGVSGVSGSGKSTLVMQELVPALQRDMGGYARKQRPAGIHKDADLMGAESLQSLVLIDQTPIGRTPRSNPATYLGIFDHIRRLYASLPESNARGYTVGRFSFNVSDGRCFECSGDGEVRVEMHFLPDVTMVCKSCKGKRYNRETLQILYKGKNIADVLQMTALEAVDFFSAHKPIATRLQLMCDVGLDYVQLGQPSTTLSGGEAQRIKLVDELAKRGGQTMYVLDEPTTGLHHHDIEKLLLVLNKLVDKGNSMVVIEHNLDVLKTVDYLIDLGPEGGNGGGVIVAQGTPVQLIQHAESHTGKYLRKIMG